MRKEVSFQFLPKTCRTLLGTQRKVTTYSLTPGNFYDFKIIDGITFSLELLQVNFHSTETCLNMYVGCDGIPITKSSNSNFWPILGLLQLDGAQPFEIGLYHGKAKPDDSNDLMRNFISECLDLIENGFRNKGTLIRIKILAFCCDAPAMSFLKKVKPFNAYFGCQKCETEGLYVFNTKKEGGRVTFPQCDAKLRTDESFRYQQQAEHHFDQQVSNLNLLPIDMIDTFAIDPMHLVFLGIMKKLLQIWTSGKRKMKIKISARAIAEISEVLKDLVDCITVEFARKTRTLDELSRFKATEFRLLLLYVLPVILKNRLPEIVYSHFLLLHVAIRILASKTHIRDERNLNYAKQLLVLFIKQSPAIYGDQFISYNVHNLQHLPDECKRLGTLESYSCFPFENHLGKLKLLVRKCAHPLEQLANRIEEIRRNLLSLSKASRHSSEINLKDEHFKGPLLVGVFGNQFKRVNVKNLRLSIKAPDNCVVLEDREVVLIQNIVQQEDDSVQLIGKKYMFSDNFFELNGLESEAIGIQKVQTLSPNLDSWPLNSVKFKAMKLPIKNHGDLHPRQEFAVLNIMNFDLNS